MSNPPVAVATFSGVVGAVLMSKRKAAGLAQAEVAGAVGLTVSTWSRIENADSALTVEQLAMAAQSLGLKPSEVLAMAEAKVEELKARGITVAAARHSTDELVSMGYLPVTGAALTSLLGPIGWAAVGAAGYALVSKLLKRDS
jgi:transcriptional regulator with XRE-family HTH domain